jgi:hypothetical protein
MYSQRHPHKDSATVLLIKTETEYKNPQSFNGRQSELLFNSADYYLFLKNSKRDTILPVVESRFKNRLPAGIYTGIEHNLSNSTAAIDSFPAWWRRYFFSIHKNAKSPLWLVQSRVSLNPPYQKSASDSIIFSISQ